MTPPKTSYNPLRYELAELAKAVFATLVAFSGALGTAAADGHIHLSGWLLSAATGLAAGGTVFGVGNKNPKEQ